MSELPHACIIGAGSSGIAAAKSLKDRDLPFDVFEKSDRIGGNWAFENPNGMSAAYRSLHINTSRERMEYEDLPMPKSYPDFPKHTHIFEYFNQYVNRFGLRELITFNTGVEHAARRPDGVWEVTLDGGERRLYDALIVANGHHWDPRWPEPAFPGHFDGTEMHAHSYVDSGTFAGKNVVVVGMGNSAMDIAVESSFVAENTYLSARRGVWIVPKYIFGKPMDQPPGPLLKLPTALKLRTSEAMLRAYLGRPENYGLPKPDHRFGHAHPTVSSDILSRISHGEVTPKPNIAELQGDRVRFTDGSVEPVDFVVYCTGYKVSFPFFDESFLSAPDNDLPLFRRVMKPDVPNVFFIGLCQPLGAIMPIAERQSRWVGDLLRGDYVPPSAAEMRGDMERERRAMFKRYVASKRHTMQVDYEDYMAGLAREMAAGRERAQARGNPVVVPARAQDAAAAAA